MVDKAVIRAVRHYLEVLAANGIDAPKAILFGSQARGTARPESDIDILVLAKEFDRNRWAKETKLHILTLQADYRIQPIPVGIRQFFQDDVSPVIEMARREGIEIQRKPRRTNKGARH